MSIQRQAYPSDLSDENWKHIEKYIPKSKSSKVTGGRPEKYPKREILNAILYLVSSGCRYCDIPHDLPPGGIVWKYFNHWSESGRWQYINKKLRQQVRVSRNKTAEPSVAIIDS
jgi:transposase